MFSLKHLFVLAAALVAAMLSTARALAQSECHPVCRWDQINDLTTSSGYVIPGAASVGQEFQPTSSSLDVVELMLEAQSSSSGSAFVRIRSGSITGTILGTSGSVSVSVLYPYPPSLRRFRFAQPVPLSPSAIHVLEVVHSGGGSLGVYLTGKGGNTYSRGRAIFQGAPVAGDDLWFREGMSPHAIEVLDQANEFPTSGGLVIPGAASVGQEFQPTASALDVVELMMDAQSSSSGSAFVRIRSGSITGTILGTSGSVSVDVAWPPPSLRRFRFEQPVSLSPSAIHVLEVVHSGGGSLGVYLTGKGGNTYSRGRAIYKGAPVTGDDLWFREGRTFVCGRCTLWTDRHVLSLQHTGTQRLMLDAGPAHAGRNYWIFGSVTGTSPGVNLLGVHVPLNPDLYTDVTIVSANTPIMANFRGTLAFDGTAQASFNVPSNVPRLRDFTLHHACIIYDNVTWYMASNPVSLKLRN